MHMGRCRVRTPAHVESHASFSECFYQFLRLLSSIHLGMGLRDRPTWTDDIGSPLGGFVISALAGTIRHADRSIGIAQQRKGELVFLGEPGVGFDVISADAQYLHVLALILLDSITESNPLSRSPTGAGAGIEPQNDRLVSKVIQIDDGTGVVLDREPGRLVADFEHPFPS
jgi:hypothetical protein